MSFELIILIETALWKRITFLNTAKLSLGFTAILEIDRFRENQDVLVSTRIYFSWNEKVHHSIFRFSPETLPYIASDKDNTAIFLLEKFTIPFTFSMFKSVAKLNAIKNGLNRDLNPGPLAPKARIIPLDHWALKDFDSGQNNFDFCKSSSATFLEVWKIQREM